MADWLASATVYVGEPDKVQKANLPHISRDLQRIIFQCATMVPRILDSGSNQDRQNQAGMAMSTFDERESAFENKFAHDAEMQFKAQARANKLLGIWAAELLGKTGTSAEAYAKEVVLSDLEEAGQEDVLRKVAGDLGDLSDVETIRAQLAKCLVHAKRQLATD
jgi:hypothetical protein